MTNETIHPIGTILTLEGTRGKRDLVQDWQVIGHGDRQYLLRRIDNKKRRAVLPFNGGNLGWMTGARHTVLQSNVVIIATREPQS